MESTARHFVVRDRRTARELAVASATNLRVEGCQQVGFLEDLLDEFAAVGSPIGGAALKVLRTGSKLFGHHDHPAPTPSSIEHVNDILFGHGGIGSVPPTPEGSGSLPDVADDAGSHYGSSAAAIALTDGKVTEAVKEMFAANEAVRTKITGILTEIATKQKALAPELAKGDPAVLMLYQKFLQTKLDELQKVLDDSKVDTKTQADILAALGEEYGKHKGDGDDKGGDNDNNGGGQGGGTGADTGAGGAGGGAGGGGADTVAPDDSGTDVADPLSGMPFGAGMGTDPLSALGPALAGLGAVPGALGGAGAGLPLDALSSLAPLAGQLAGQGADDGFDDPGKPADDDASEFVDDKNGAKPSQDGESTEPAGNDPGNAEPGAASGQGTPEAAAPQSQLIDSAGVVQMPDGSGSVTTQPQKATAVRAVLGGAGVSDAYRSDGVDLPPPGTPVTRPADPNHLQAGDLAQFKSREPVMYMGNGKIWVDGQLQPLAALPGGPDFLAWFDPIQSAGVTPAAVPAAVAGP